MEGCPKGVVDPQTAIDMRSFPDHLILKVILANVPQLIFSFLYFSYNALFTSMLMGYEWVSYAYKRKGLRVSRQPLGAQRCTYFLQLPYRFGIPLMILSGILHWLVSQSLFLISIDFYDGLGNPGDGSGRGQRVFDYKILGYSPPAIISVMILGGAMTISIIAFGYIPYKRGMVIAGSSSMAISAACHGVSRHGESEASASTEKLQWGAVSTGQDVVGHCAFSSREVEPPILGKFYVGADLRLAPQS